MHSYRLCTYSFHVDYSTKIWLWQDCKTDVYSTAPVVLRKVVQHLADKQDVSKLTCL